MCLCICYVGYVFMCWLVRVFAFLFVPIGCAFVCVCWLFVCLSVCLSVRVFVCLFLLFFLVVCVRLFLLLSSFVSVCLSGYLCVWLRISAAACLFVFVVC